MSHDSSLVCTSIYDPVCLENYYKNFRKYGRLEKVRVYLIPDLKTPKSAFKKCDALKKEGLNVFCPTIDEQEEFLKKIGFDPHLVPYNSDNRRNIGFLMALESGTDVIISIDDDNYCTEDVDFLKAHEVVCSKSHETELVSTKTGWFNICDQLKFSPNVRTYPRGFPYYARHKTDKLNIVRKTVPIHMNAGLWLKDPDVDAMSWLVNPTTAISFKGKSYSLDESTWSPVNTQNTSMRREVMSCYYFLKMNYPMGGIEIDRFGDIYSGYFSQACIKNMGGTVRFGSPVVIHKRNSHNYLYDAGNEFAGIMVLEDLLPWLTDDLKLSGSTYSENYQCLSELLHDNIESFKGKIWNDSTKAYFHQMAYYMKRWVLVCKQFI